MNAGALLEREPLTFGRGALAHGPREIQVVADEYAFTRVEAVRWIEDCLFLVGSISSSLARATRDIAVAAAIGAGVGILANLALASVAGAVGTAVAITLGQSLAAIIVIRAGARHASPLVPWRVVGLLTALAAVVVLGFTQPAGGLATGLRLAIAILVELVLVREFARGRSA